MASSGIDPANLAPPQGGDASNPAGAVCDPVTGVCRLPARAAEKDGLGAGLFPLPRTLRPLAVLEDEAGNKVDPVMFKGKVRNFRCHGVLL